MEAKCGTDEIFFCDENLILPQYSVGLHTDIIFHLSIPGVENGIQIIPNDKRELGIKIYQPNMDCARRLSFVGVNAPTSTRKTSYYRAGNSVLQIDRTIRDYIARQCGIKLNQGILAPNKNLLVIPEFFLIPKKAIWNYEISQEDKNNYILDDLNITIKLGFCRIRTIKPLKLNYNRIMSKIVELKNKDGELFIEDDDFAIPQQSIDSICGIEAQIEFLPGKKEMKVS